MTVPYAYYNENDPFAVQWLRNLIAAGHIAPGIVDDRSIHDVRSGDLAGFRQCHFFAGIGVWSYALRRAGWTDDRPIWTGSCPCQPFSGAGQRKGMADARHLWPVWQRLISERRPGVVFGEQVANKLALDWLDHVHTDMEATDYAFAAVDLGVAGVGGPHWRQRLWWIAYADGEQWNGRGTGFTGRCAEPANCVEDNDMADAGRAGLSPRERRELSGSHGNDQRRAVEQCERASRGMAYADGGNAGTEGLQRSGEHGQFTEDGRASRMANAECGQLSQPIGRPQERNGERSDRAGIGHNYGRPGPVNGFWRDADWLRCTDGKWRPVESGTFPLAHGIAGRVGQLRAYGNAICAEVAEAFITAAMECLP